jgi:hypothetical protein
MDNDGYVIFRPFGFSMDVPDKIYTAFGTPNFVSIEFIAREGHK